MASAPATAVQQVDSADLVLRRIPGEWVVERDGVPRPSSQAFNNDGDGEPMSGFLDSTVAALGHRRPDILIDHAEGFFAVALVVQGLVDEQQTVVPDPIEPPVHPCDPAHVGVVGQKANRRRSRLARLARWIDEACPVGAVETIAAERT